MWTKENYEAKEAERAKERENRRKKPWYWLGQVDPTARFTAYLAVFTFCLILVSILQWVTIESGSSDTRDLAIAAKGQLAELEAEQRPWIKQFITIAGLQFGSSNDVNIFYSVDFRNVGKSPAQHIVRYITAQLVTKDTVFDSMKEERSACDIAARTSANNKTDPGIFLFPGDSAPKLIEGNGGGSVHLQNLDYGSAWFSPTHVSFMLFGCFDYLISQTSGDHGQTGFAYFISKKLPNFPNSQTGFDPVPGSVPLDQIIFSPDPFSNGVIK